MDYSTFRPVIKLSYKQQTSHRNNFAENNYNYVNGTKTTKSSKMITQKYLFSQSQNIPQTTSNSVNFHDQPRSSQEQVKITHFFNKIKIIQTNTRPEINLIIIQQIIFHQMMKNTIIKTINDFIQAKDLVPTELAKQTFLNHTHEVNNYDNLETIQHLTTINFNNKTQLTHNHTNQLKCMTKLHCHIMYNSMK